MDITSVFKKAEDESEEIALRKERAEEIHEESIVIDGHEGTLFDLIREKRKFDDESSEGHSDLPRLRQGGVDCAIFTLHFLMTGFGPYAVSNKDLSI